MTADERYKITSNEYADIIIKYNDNRKILDRFAGESRILVNPQFAIFYIPVQQVMERSILQYGYASIPRCFGLTSGQSIEASQITRLRSIPSLNLRGKGTLIGIVDTGIDYTNPVFQYADKTTRIVNIWDQTIDSGNYPDDMYYGTEYSREQINQALRDSNPLNIVPSMDENGHGTIIAGVAAGNSSAENDFYGVAPDAELVVVKLKPAKPYLKGFYKIPEEALCYQENDIMVGLEYLFRIAARENRPIAIGIALGTSLGGHDGYGHLSYYITERAATPGIGIAIAVGNEGNARRHYFGEIMREEPFETVELNVGEGETGFVMEVWGRAVSILSLDILTPSGEYIPQISGGLEGQRKIAFLFEETTIDVLYLVNEEQSGNMVIMLRFTKPASGVWRFRVYTTSDINTTFNIWLPMGDFITENTYFINADPFITILAPSDTYVPITVTAYNTSNQSLYLEASKGFNRDDVPVPDITAPGVNIVTPTLTKQFAPASGTGIAAAHTAGVAAMLLEWGIVQGNIPLLSTTGIRLLLIRGAKRTEGQEYPNQNWGFGILDIYNTFQVLRSG